MDIGADLFLQMMKGIYPGYTDESTEKSREWFQKAGQKFLAEMSGKTMGEKAEAFFKSWMERFQEAPAKGMFTMDSEIQSKMMQRIIENGNLYVKFMNTVLEATQAAYAGEGSDEKLKEIHENMSDHLLELYQESVGKYLGVPQFGIPREALQQINSAISAYHRFIGAVGDFLIMFSTPFKKSMDILQQATKDRERTDEGFESAKEVYDFAVKIFDKEYDDWLKSPAGVQSVANMVDNYLEYRKKLSPVKDIWLKSLSIPTKREMEDVYRGIYDLKKKTRKQDAMIREQNDIIKALNQKIQKLEIAISDSSQKKKASASISAPQKKKTKSSAGPKKKAKAS